MKFWITRTSDDTSKEPPCKNAKFEKSVYHLYTTHNIYTIEIKDLDELLAFISDVEQEVIINKISDDLRSRFGLEDIKYSIEIYDDYRE